MQGTLGSCNVLKYFSMRIASTLVMLTDVMLQGDSVNTASRMESNGFPMTVHVSEAFVNDMHDPSMFVPCGPRVIKGKGDMVTYLAKVRLHLHRRHPPGFATSVDKVMKSCHP